MSGRSRRWVCCLAVVVLTALSGWRVAESGGSVATAMVGRATAVGEMPDVATDVTNLHSRRAVAEPATAKRVEIERLLAVAVTAAAIVLVAAGAGLARADDRVRGLADRSLLRSRAPPVDLVSWS